MKKVLLIIALFVLSFNKVQAANINQLTDDGKMAQALSVLEQSGSQDVLDRLEKSSTKVVFYDLSLISFSYAKHYAVASTDDNGNNFILINEKFRSSSPEAIACLIAHESVHQLAQATLEEEVRATTTEAQTWIKLRNNSVKNDELTNRLNNLATMYEESTNGDNLIKRSIASNSFYQQQLALN